MVNIELIRPEAIDIKHALMCYIKECKELLQNEIFCSQYPSCAEALRELIKRDEALLERIRQELARP